MRRRVPVDRRLPIRDQLRVIDERPTPDRKSRPIEDANSSWRPDDELLRNRVGRAAVRIEGEPTDASSIIRDDRQVESDLAAVFWRDDRFSGGRDEPKLLRVVDRGASV